MQDLKTLREKHPIKIIGLCCKNALSTLDGEQYLQRKGGLSLELAINIVQLPCSSKVESLGIIKAFESGADAIFVLGCPDEKCRLLDGNYRARKVIAYTKGLLDEIGIENSRLEMFQLGTSEGVHLDQIIISMAEHVRTLRHDTV